MNLIDTHAHLTSPQLAKNTTNILKKASKEGITKVISIGCSIKEAQESIVLAEKHPSIYATVGLYPHDNESSKFKHLTADQRLIRIEKLAKHPKVIAVGECGLDFTTPPPWEQKRSKDKQAFIFKSQIEIANKLNKPIIIHSRNATTETLKILKRHTISGVWHCFVEDITIAQQVIDLGLIISFTGLITYKNAGKLISVIKEIPLEKILIETDSPYLVPQKAKTHGIKVNEPLYVKMIAQEIAKIKDIPLENVAKATTKNAVKLFKL